MAAELSGYWRRWAIRETAALMALGKPRDVAEPFAFLQAKVRQEFEPQVGRVAAAEASFVVRNMRGKPAFSLDVLPELVPDALREDFDGAPAGTSS